MQIFKNEMLKLGSKGSLSDRISHILFYNHITPQSTTGLSPAELLQRRRLRSRLDLIKPDLQVRVEQKQYNQQSQSNTCARDRHFTIGESVYIRNFNTRPQWVSGKIRAPIGNVSYEIVLDDGRICRRHVDHIRKRFDVPSDSPVVDLPSFTITPTPSTLDSHAENESFVQPKSPIRSAMPDQPDSIDVSPVPSSPPISSPSPSVVNRYPKRQRIPPNYYIPPNFRKEKTVVNQD